MAYNISKVARNQFVKSVPTPIPSPPGKKERTWSNTFHYAILIIFIIIGVLIAKTVQIVVTKKIEKVVEPLI